MQPVKIGKPVLEDKSAPSSAEVSLEAGQLPEKAAAAVPAPATDPAGRASPDPETSSRRVVSDTTAEAFNQQRLVSNAEAGTSGWEPRDRSNRSEPHMPHRRSPSRSRSARDRDPDRSRQRPSTRSHEQQQEQRSESSPQRSRLADTERGSAGASRKRSEPEGYEQRKLRQQLLHMKEDEASLIGSIDRHTAGLSVPSFMK